VVEQLSGSYRPPRAARVLSSGRRAGASDGQTQAGSHGLNKAASMLPAFLHPDEVDLSSVGSRQLLQFRRSETLRDQLNSVPVLAKGQQRTTGCTCARQTASHPMTWSSSAAKKRNAIAWATAHGTSVLGHAGGCSEAHVDLLRARYKLRRQRDAPWSSRQTKETTSPGRRHRPLQVAFSA
jgi:hypothetical protein